MPLLGCFQNDVFEYLFKTQVYIMLENPPVLAVAC